MKARNPPQWLIVLRWRANPISRFISGTRDLHHHHYSPLYRSLCLSLWDNSPCDFTYSRLQFTSKWKEDPAEDCLSTHFFFFSLQLSITLVLLCGGTRGENKPSCIFYLRFKFHRSKLQMWAAGQSNSSNCRPEAEGGGKSEEKNCIELLPISCKHRMSSSHTKISDQKNSKKDWRKEGRNRERKKEKRMKERTNIIKLINCRVVTQCHYLYLYLSCAPNIRICIL